KEERSSLSVFSSFFSFLLSFLFSSSSLLPSPSPPPSPPPPPSFTSPSSSLLASSLSLLLQEKDLESDKTFWALYERWCEAFNQKLDHDEKVQWFNTFKKTVLHIHKKPNVGYRRGITKFADGKLRKPCCYAELVGCPSSFT
ncbi:hypothetical protein ZWY2020_028301, partial [Hordeum vulgare]